MLCNADGTLPPTGALLRMEIDTLRVLLKKYFKFFGIDQKVTETLPYAHTITNFANLKKLTIC